MISISHEAFRKCIIILHQLIYETIESKIVKFNCHHFLLRKSNNTIYSDVKSNKLDEQICNGIYINIIDI